MTTTVAPDLKPDPKAKNGQPLAGMWPIPPEKSPTLAPSTPPKDARSAPTPTTTPPEDARSAPTLRRPHSSSLDTHA